MMLFRSSRCARFTALSLVVAMYLLPGVCAPVLGAQQVVKQSLVVFPFDTTAVKGAPDDMCFLFADAVRSSLAGNKSYTVVAYSERLPSIARAIKDGSLKKEDVAGPFGTEKDQCERAVKIGASVAADYCLVGSIDDYKFDEAKKQAMVTVTALLADTKTGKSVKTISVTGRSPEGTNVTDEAGLMQLAAGDAVAKTATEIAPEAKPLDPNNPQPQQVYVEQPSKKKSGFKKYLLPLLLAVGIGIAVSGGSDDGGGGFIPPPSD